MHLADGGRIRIVSDAVMEVLHNESVSTGVRTYSEVIEADAVVMCAGALATPRILLQSGLSSLNSEIGWGLQDHPAITFALELRHDSNAFFDTGVVSKGTTSAGEQYLIVAYERASWSESNLGLVSVILLTPYSRGSVRLVENDCQVQINMLDDARDVVSMREAVRVLMHTVSHTGFDTISHQIYADDEGRCLDDVRELSTVELDMWIRKNLRPVSHVASSCHQAVNSSGALKFVEGVFLADASVLPRVPPSTPAGPVTIESRRIAHLLEGLML
jgi:choline dehydrogenase-like flavoprotein